MPDSMSASKQAGRLASLPGQQFDLAVIGGGIIGAGIARDAARRGLRVALFEKYDYASGTSSRSTRLIHGGLRYLEMFDFGLVRMDLKEREILLRIAPHLVRPLAFLVPMYRKSLFYRFKLRIGMWLYDWLSFDKSLPNHRFFSKHKTLELEPSLKSDGLQGASMYYDGQVALAERLTLENILDARQHGAQCFNYARVENLIRAKGQVTGLTITDELAGADSDPVQVQARLVINATGAWLDGLEKKLTGQVQQRVRRTKGIHFTAPATVNNALVLFAEEDDRLLFVIPWLGFSWVGTTDTDFNSDLENVRANRDDVEYLLESVRIIFPKSDWDTIYYTNAGVRALARTGKSGDKDESAVSRKHTLVDHAKVGDAPGLLSVVGGKITAYRGIAEEAVDLAAKKLGVSATSSTGNKALPGGNTGDINDFTGLLQTEAGKLGIGQDSIKYLVSLYGSRAREVLKLVEAGPELAQPLHPAYPDIQAQIQFAVEQEQCLTLRDFMMRRTALYFTPDQGRLAAPAVSESLAELLDWDEERRRQEEAAYAQELAWTQEWRNDSTTPAGRASVAASQPAGDVLEVH